MREWKKLFRQEGYYQVAQNKFHNEANNETVIFEDGLVFVRVKSKEVPLRQSLLSACVSFIEENTFVTEERKLIGILFKDDSFMIINRSEVENVYRIGQPKKAFKKEIVGAAFLEDTDKIIIADQGGRIHSLDPKTFNSGDEINLKDYFKKFISPATFLGKIDRDGAAKKYLIVITEKNKVKKSELITYNNFKSSNIVIDLKEEDKIIYAASANDEEEIIFIAEDFKALRLSVSEFPSVDKQGRGYKAFDTQKNILSATLTSPDAFVLTSGNKKGKLTKADGFPFGGRSTNGRMISEETDKVISVKDQIIVIDEENRMALMDITQVPTKHYKSTGVKIIASELKHIFS